MMNSLVGSSMGSIKSENSCSDFKPTSPNESTTISEPPKKATCTSTTTASDLMEQSTNSLTPPSLNFPSLKFELDGDVEVESPDHSIWESLFSEQFDTDFMVLSPVANNLPNSPQRGGGAFGYNGQAMQGQTSLSGCSPPRFGSSPLGAFSRDNSKGKGLSPLRRVFNSPVNYIQQEPENLQSLPPASIEDFLDDYQRDGFVAAYNNPNLNPTTTCTSNMSSNSSSQSYHNPMDCNMSNTMQNPSRFSRSVSETSLGTACNSQMTQESRGGGAPYHHMGSNCGAPLSQQLMHERQQEKQQHMQMHPQKQHHHNNLNYNNMMAPSLPPVAPEPVKYSYLIITYVHLVFDLQYEKIILIKCVRSSTLHTICSCGHMHVPSLA